MGRLGLTLSTPGPTTQGSQVVSRSGTHRSSVQKLLTCDPSDRLRLPRECPESLRGTPTVPRPQSSEDEGTPRRRTLVLRELTLRLLTGRRKLKSPGPGMGGPKRPCHYHPRVRLPGRDRTEPTEVGGNGVDRVGTTGGPLVPLNTVRETGSRSRGAP